MTWWIFEKTPPNSGGVAGFKWSRHGSRHRFNGGGRMAEETFFFLNFPKMTDWAVLGWFDPTLNLVLESKWDEQHALARAPRELLNSRSQRRHHAGTMHQREFSHGLSRSRRRHHASTTHASNERWWQWLQTMVATPWFYFFLFCFFCFCLTLFFNFWFCFFVSVQPSSTNYIGEDD